MNTRNVKRITFSATIENGKLAMYEVRIKHPEGKDTSDLVLLGKTSGIDEEYPPMTLAYSLGHAAMRLNAYFVNEFRDEEQKKL